ncbi:MAG: NAD(P)-dependent oxidoreductase [Metallosphaera sp.]|uniref:NAD-dependent epimerase/dehydratase family protein n=1 Tax=Metallosphaera sp. TaxID=2020860 RepID=UPI00316353F5
MILVTGCTGFIGSQLIKKLNDVLCVANKDHFSINRIDGVQYVFVDLTDREKVKDLLKKAKPDLVINLASKTPVRLSYDDTSFMNNAVITYNISMADAPIIHASTAEVYPYTPYPHYYREDEAYKAPSSPYAVSKIASEMLLAGRKEKTIILRPINTIGRPISRLPDEARGYFFEKTVLAMLTGAKEIHYDGHPNSSRQWMFYEDHVNAYLHVIKNLDRMEGVYNVSVHYTKYNHVLTLEETVSIISKELGWEGKITWMNNPRPVDPNYLLLDSDKIYRTGFEVDDPIVAIRKAIGSLKKEVEMLKASELKAEVQHGS